MNVFDKLDRAEALTKTVPMCARGEIIARELCAHFRAMLIQDLKLIPPRSTNGRR